MQYENVALNKMANQKTTMDESSASRAVDGNTGDELLSRTKRQDPPQWWTVDLEDDYYITSVSIYTVPSSQS